MILPAAWALMTEGHKLDDDSHPDMVTCAPGAHMHQPCSNGAAMGACYHAPTCTNGHQWAHMQHYKRRKEINRKERCKITYCPLRVGARPPVRL